MDFLKKIWHPEDNQDRNAPNTWTGLYLEGMPTDCNVTKIRSKAYIFGKNVRNKDRSLFWCGDLEANTFSKIVSSSPIGPKPRTNFQMVAGIEPDTLVLAGGISDDQLCCDIWLYRIKQKCWEMLVSPESAASEIVSYQGQSMRSHADAYLLFGGCNSHNQYSNTLFLFNPATLAAKQLYPTGKVPSPRYMHQCIIVGDNMYIFGGRGHLPSRTATIDVYCLDLNTLDWREVISSGELPCARAAHSCIYDNVSQSIFLFGGLSNKSQRMNDLYTFHLRSFSWHFVRHQGSLNPMPRAFHACTLHGESLYIFGGNENSKHADVLKFQIRVQPLRLVELASRLLLALESSGL